MRAIRPHWLPSSRLPRRSVSCCRPKSKTTLRGSPFGERCWAKRWLKAISSPSSNWPASAHSEASEMWLIRIALRRPLTVLVAVISVGLLSILALLRMPVDIFPNLNLPVIYVAQPYGGMSPAQMEGYLVYYYEYHFLYITGIESVESKSIQNVGLLKLTFHPGTDMSQALAQT